MHVASYFYSRAGDEGSVEWPDEDAGLRLIRRDSGPATTQMQKVVVIRGLITLPACLDDGVVGAPPLIARVANTKERLWI